MADKRILYINNRSGRIKKFNLKLLLNEENGTFLIDDILNNKDIHRK
jgi:hypothetical protein